MMTVIVPHPDDEVLGFAGVIAAARAHGVPVRVAIATDGQSYCAACAFWLYGRKSQPGDVPCDLDDQFEFSRVRRQESLRGLAVLGVPAANVRFLGAFDGTLPSMLEPTGSAEPIRCMPADPTPQPWPRKTSAALHAQLTSVIAESGDGPIFTTHSLDGHGDHAALYDLVLAAAAEAGHTGPVYASVIHDQSAASCDYPNPSATVCYADEVSIEGASHAALRKLRPDPKSWWLPPTDLDSYGESLHFCLPAGLYEGESPLKLTAIEQHATQLGAAARRGAVPGDDLYWLDRDGYMLSFLHRDELLFPGPILP